MISRSRSPDGRRPRNILRWAIGVALVLTAVRLAVYSARHPHSHSGPVVLQPQQQPAAAPSPQQQQREDTAATQTSIPEPGHQPHPAQPQQASRTQPATPEQEADLAAAEDSGPWGPNSTAVEPFPMNITAKPATPVQLPYALWWFAPFFTGTGYGLEAQHYMLSLRQTGLVRPADLWISHHGDHMHTKYINTVPRADLGPLFAMAANARRQQLRRAIMVCHSLPYFWGVGDDLPWTANKADGCPGPFRRRAYKVGRTMCEVDGIPHDMALLCNNMDEVWVPSEWARGVFIKSGVEAEKLVVLPEGVDTVKFDPARYEPVQLPQGQQVLGLPRLPEGQPVLGLPRLPEGQPVLGHPRQLAGQRRPYVFLSSFKWESRKGYDVLLKAYLQEFKPHDPVELYIMTKPFGNVSDDLAGVVRDWTRAHLGLPPRSCNLTSPAPPSPPPAVGEDEDSDLGLVLQVPPRDGGAASPAVQCEEPPMPPLPPVYLITGHVPDEELPRYYRAADAFVLPSRGEGWGRPHVEAMSMGLPLISTNWSGMTAYLDASVGYPVAVESLVEADENNADYFKGFKWAQPSVSHLQQLMRHVVDHPEEARARGRAARERMVTEYSSEAVGLKVVREVLRITRKLQAQGAATKQDLIRARRRRRRAAPWPKR